MKEAFREGLRRTVLSVLVINVTVLRWFSVAERRSVVYMLRSYYYCSEKVLEGALKVDNMQMQYMEVTGPIVTVDESFRFVCLGWSTDVNVVQSETRQWHIGMTRSKCSIVVRDRTFGSSTRLREQAESKLGDFTNFGKDFTAIAASPCEQVL